MNFSGPFSAYATKLIAMPFIMIVVTTSWAPVFTLRIRGDRRVQPCLPPSRRRGRAGDAETPAGSRASSAAHDAVTIADQELTFDADVEQPALEAHRHRERREDQRRRDREHRPMLVASLNAKLQHRAVDVERVLSVQDDDQRARRAIAIANATRSASALDRSPTRATRASERGRRATMPTPATISSPPPASRAPEHPEPDLLRRRVGRVLPGDPAFVDRHDPVGEGVDLVELGRDQEHAPSFLLLVEDLPPHELDRPDVEPAGRLGRDQQLRARVQLAGEDQLLLVPTRERARVHVDRPRPDVERLDEPLRHRLDLLDEEEAVRPENGRSSSRPRTAFSQSVMSSTSPCSCRSSGM